MNPQLMDIKINAKLPEIPAELPVYLVRAASLEERQPAIRLFQELLKLENLVAVNDEDSLYYESADGEIQFFRASGSLWSETTRADDQYSDERRPWKVVKAADPSDPTNSRLVLIESEAKLLAKQAEELFMEAGLLSPEAFFAGVNLDQVAKLDAEGKEIERSAGQANVRFLYRLDEIEVDGPGAKTYAFYDPGTFVGAYHAWRPVKDMRKVKISSINEILDCCLMHDTELQLYLQRGSQIALQQVDLVYWAMRPEANQDYVFPALRVDGSVVFTESLNEPEGFEFSRLYNAAMPQQYAASQIYADYLVKQFDD